MWGEAVLFSFFKFYIMRLLYYFYNLKKKLRGKMCSNQTNGGARGGNEKCWFPFLMIPTPRPPHTPKFRVFSPRPSGAQLAQGMPRLAPKGHRHSSGSGRPAPDHS